MEGLKLLDGRDRVVRHGHGPQRAIQTGVGPIEVRRAKVRDRADVAAEEKIRFTSSILPKWTRRTKSLDALLPILYLRGVDRRLPGGAHRTVGKGRAEPVAGRGGAANRGVAGGLRCLAEAQPLAAALRARVGGRRLPAGAHGRERRMHAGADRRHPEGKKELVGFQTGVRESAQSWRELLIDIKRCGLEIAPTSLSATARSASGRRSRRSFPVPSTNAAGFTRLRAEPGRPLGPGQHEGRPSRDLRSIDPRPPSLPSTCSPRNTAPNTRRRHRIVSRGACKPVKPAAPSSKPVENGQRNPPTRGGMRN
jgi:hypothetical protein